ncbi:MAG: hypothetical protein DLM55_08835 [Acidimicrobiales bacterium]|nr:MAG: hypothetical protein DLM55_08835 [Acidimicrobiales bacterium]
MPGNPLALYQPQPYPLPAPSSAAPIYESEQYPVEQPWATPIAQAVQNFADDSSANEYDASEGDSVQDVLWRRITLGTAGMLIVVVSVAITLLVTHSSESKTDNAVAIPPGPAGPTVSLATREQDPIPLTVKEVFPTKALQLGKVRYEVLASEEVKGCPETVNGNAAATLRSLDCTQVIRAAITDPDRKFLITAGILNLAKAEDVDALAQVLRSAGGGNFDMIVPTSMSVEAAQARPLHFSRNGHYLTFTTGVPIKIKPGENIFENAQLSQALNITRVLTTNALDRRELGAGVGH